MSYRIKERPPHKPKRTMENLATPVTVFIQNGTKEHVAIPCWYVEVTPPIKAHPHSRQHHDHIGWPSPRHPDHICQAWDLAHSCCSFNRHKHRCDHCEHFIDMDRMVPIHLLDEGYKSVKVVFKNAPSGLTATAKIDDSVDIVEKKRHTKDWIIRITFEAKCNAAMDEHVDVEYAVFASGTLKGGKEVTDIVSRGIVRIMPGPYAN